MLSFVQLSPQIPDLGVLWIQGIKVPNSLILQINNLMPEMIKGTIPFGSAGEVQIIRLDFFFVLFSFLLLTNTIYKHHNRINCEFNHLISIQSITLSCFESLQISKYHIFASTVTGLYFMMWCTLTILLKNSYRGVEVYRKV